MPHSFLLVNEEKVEIKTKTDREWELKNVILTGLVLLWSLSDYRGKML
jgi:hypothetical protein